MECYICKRHQHQSRPGSHYDGSHHENSMYLLECGRTAHWGCLQEKGEYDSCAGRIITCECTKVHYKKDFRKMKIGRDELQTTKVSIAALKVELRNLHTLEDKDEVTDYPSLLLTQSPVWQPNGYPHCENCYGTHELEVCPNDFFIREDVKTRNGNGVVSYTTRMRHGSEFSAGLAFERMVVNFKNECGLDLGNMSSKFKTVSFTGLVAMTFWNKMCPHCGFPFHRPGEDGSPECLSAIKLDHHELKKWSKLKTFLENYYGDSTKNAKEQMGFVVEDDMSVSNE